MLTRVVWKKEYIMYVINNTNASVDFDAMPITLNTQGSFLIGDLNQIAF